MQSYKKQKGFAALPIVIVVVVLAAVVGGYFVMSKHKPMSGEAQLPGSMQNESGTSSGGLNQMTNEATVTPAPKAAFTANEVTDTSISADVNSFDTKLSATNTDATNIDTGLNDQQGNLSEQ